MKWSVGTKMGAGFGVVLLIFVIVGVLSYRSTTQLIGASEWRQHTYEVLGQLDAVLSQLQDVETGQRGYLLTGDEKYLEPYQNGLGKIDISLKEVRRLTADNPRQQRRLRHRCRICCFQRRTEQHHNEHEFRNSCPPIGSDCQIQHNIQQLQ